MPEIAEVARITSFLRQHLVGKRIGKALAPEDNNVFGKVGTSGHEFQRAVTGKTVVGAGSQGKYFWILMETPPHPVMHFGMTGWIEIRGLQTAYNRYAERVKGDKEQWPPRFWKFQLETDSNPKVEVAFTDARRFGRVRLVDCPGEDIRKHTPLKENGPDPVVDKGIFTEDYLRTKMHSRHVPIKALLLDQAMISGIGNWVGDEIMWQAKMHPEQYSDDFSDADIAVLYKAVKYVCDTAVGHLGNSDEFPQDWLFHYRWGKGKKDAISSLPTGEKLAFIEVGGRTSCIVPALQKKRGKNAVENVREKSKGEVNGAKGETESKFFDDKTVKKPSVRPKVNKALGRSTPAKRKAVKDEEEEKPTFKEAKKVKTSDEGKSSEALQGIGRRRSNRLSGKV